MLAGSVAADEPPAAASLPQQESIDPVTGNELTPEARVAIDRGLAYLASRQQDDGWFGGGGFGASSGVTALSGIALMSSGSLPGRGPYGEEVQKSVDAIVGSAQPNGLLAPDGHHGVMYSHGFAALFLAEVYGMTGDERVKEVLQRAIRLIEKSQNAEGGWRYQPSPVDADISVTICQIMALRAARDAGIRVDPEVIEKALEYVRACQNRDGGFSYQLRSGRPGGGSGFARSAAGLASLYYAGIYEGDAIDRGLAYIQKQAPGGGRSMPAHYFYGQYYAVQVMFLAGGESWQEWYPAIRDELIRRQGSRGEWSGEINDEYCTAMALIVLQMPNRYLPVFSGKGPGS
jgi:hypothetical protein